ncbi:MAG: hypothetical protein K0R59_1227 [Sphingobacterium sp.]|jgi:hypothetical protein|nr:hypothetical protein [Sphingobacterium sp.]
MIDFTTATLPLGKQPITKGASIALENRNHLASFLKNKVWKIKRHGYRFSISNLYKIQIPKTNDNYSF